MCARLRRLRHAAPACRTAARSPASPTSAGAPPSAEVERLEVWLFDFDEDIYGQTIETELIAFLRPEMQFDGLDALKAQIAVDAAAARISLDPK